MMRAVRPGSFSVRTDELRTIVRRSREVVLLAALTGFLTGLGVRGFEFLVEEVLLDAVYHAPLWAMATAPALGVIASALILRFVGGGASGSTSDEYLRAFHDPAYHIRPRYVIARISAAVVTLGAGGALGLEGPSIYGGSSIGAALQKKLPRPLRGNDHRTLLVAGAAAGVAAIFKAPATGAIFALEVPYRDDVARRMLLPALVSSATGYLTFVTLTDTTPLLGVGTITITDFNLLDLFGALLVGVTCAVGARAFARLMRMAKNYSVGPMPMRLLVSSIGLTGLFFLSKELTGQPLSIGAGYDVFHEFLFPQLNIAIWLLLAVFVIRCLASALTLGGGGVGGVFVPLVVGGGLVGRTMAELIHPARASLYTLLGIAAFLGAGYRVPLAAVMFVAETTGKPNFVVPALFAAVAAELVMGDQSITAYQRRPGTD
jgi:CIC family chloride channel protein